RKIRMKLLLRHEWPQQRTIVAYLERPGEGQNQTPEMACIGPWHETADHIFICVKVALGAKRTCLDVWVYPASAEGEPNRPYRIAPLRRFIMLTERVPVWNRPPPATYDTRFPNATEERMMVPRRRFPHLAAIVAALLAVSAIANAQGYPSRTVRIVVGFPPGQAIDI